MKETKRQSVNHQMLERLIYIHKRIKAEKYPNCTFLSKKLECSIPAINRDIEFLRDRFLAPIEYDSAKKGYYYTQEYNMPLNSISAKNLIALSSAKILLSNYKGTPIYDDLCNVINLMTFSEIRGNTDFIDRIAVPPASPIIIDETIWNTIYSAMKNNSIIEFDYNGRHNTETTHRRVRPYQILLDDGLCFLFGFCELRTANCEMRNACFVFHELKILSSLMTILRCLKIMNFHPDAEEVNLEFLFQLLFENIRFVFTVRLVNM